MQPYFSKMALLSEYSLWLLIPCILLGIGYACLLYYKNRTIEYEKRPRRIMAILRGIVITLIAFLLLAPMIKTTKKKTEKPIVVFAIDNSESLLLTKDSSYNKTQLLTDVNNAMKSLGNKYDTKLYFFGEKNQVAGENDVLTFADKKTDISAIFDEVSSTYAFQNVGALVLLTDGIYNQGSNPYYKAQKSKFTVHTVGLGDAEMQTDLSINDIQNNRKTFKGNLFPVEIKIAATQLAGKQTTLTVSEKDKVLFTKDIRLNSKKHFETVKMFIEATTKGIHKYTVTLSEVEGEITNKNNTATFFVEVVDTKEKIAIVYNAPHPDISAINQALEMTEKYQVETFAANEFNSNVGQYSLIILHQLPSTQNSITPTLEKIKKDKIPVLYILGSQSNLNAFNTLASGVKINKSKNLFNDASPLYNNNFSSFTFSEETQQMLKRFPPLQTYFGEYQTAISTNVFLYQKISQVETDYPLISFNDNAGVKTGVIAGSGLWQWKIYNYIYAQNHEAFNEIINKTVQYLSVKSDKSQFRVHAPDIVDENNNVEFSAELYNDSYELITDQDVTMTLTDENGKKYTSQFSKQNNSYHLNLGHLPTGDYQWTAETELSGKKLTKSGLLTIREVMIESVNLVADHPLLQSIAQTSQGKFFTKEQIGEISKAIQDDPNIITIASYEKNFNLLSNHWLYFVIIILLFGVEWFMRKWGGGY